MRTLPWAGAPADRSRSQPARPVALFRSYGTPQSDMTIVSVHRRLRRAPADSYSEVPTAPRSRSARIGLPGLFRVGPRQVRGPSIAAIPGVASAPTPNLSVWIREGSTRHAVSARLTEAHAEAIAGDPRLGDLNNHLANLVVIANAYLVIGQAINSEVLTKSTRLQVVSAEFGGPVVVGGELHQHSAVLSSVSIEITLTVAVDVEPANHARPVNRCFPNPGVHGSIAPAHVLGHTDIYRHQFGHRTDLPFDTGM
jgi:hypothetical protein